MDKKTFKLNAPYQLESIVHHNENAKVLILLLHGYCQRGSFIFKKLFSSLPKCAEVHAPTAPFPLLSGHPLERREANRKLIMGHAWYFYDATADSFYIPYEIPVKILNNYLSTYNPRNLPVIVVGYSQGGYLLPFLAQKNNQIEHIIGLNCSYRVDMLSKPLDVKADAINGVEDELVNPLLAGKRQSELFGEFILLEDQNHYLTSSFGRELSRLIEQSPALD